MSQSLYTAAVGMRAQQQRIDTLANNVANVNTNGFKKSRVDFKDAVYQALRNPATQAGGAAVAGQLGQGVLIDSEKKIMNDGALEETGRMLDLALSGEGFYALENPDGPILYSRDGVFISQPQADGSHALTTVNGYYVLDQAGERIQSNFPLDGISVNSQGQMTVGGLFAGQLGRFTFTSPEALEAAGGKTFLATDGSGEPQESQTAVYQGFVENSNVDLAEEMTRLMRAQRAYALLGRAITTADQMKATENDIRR